MKAGVRLDLRDHAAGIRRTVDAGWRDYYLASHDPRWASLSNQPKLMSIMAEVKADIDVQRARMKEIDAADDFGARLDAALAANNARATPR